MARTTDADVFQVVSDDVPHVSPDGSAVSLAAFIALAHLDVEDLLGTSDLGETRKTAIETYLAAHYAVLKYKFIASEGAGSVNAGYQNHQESGGYGLTHYGIMAMTLDATGTLKGLSEEGTSRQRPGVVWLGE